MKEYVFGDTITVSFEDELEEGEIRADLIDSEELINLFPCVIADPSIQDTVHGQVYETFVPPGFIVYNANTDMFYRPHYFKKIDSDTNIDDLIFSI